MGGTRKDWVF